MSSTRPRMNRARLAAAACAKCHGEDGNSKIPGTPSLAGQQPHYLVAAIQEYHQGDRSIDPMRSSLRESGQPETGKPGAVFLVADPGETRRADARRCGGGRARDRHVRRLPWFPRRERRRRDAQPRRPGCRIPGQGDQVVPDDAQELGHGALCLRPERQGHRQHRRILRDAGAQGGGPGADVHAGTGGEMQPLPRPGRQPDDGGAED